MTREKKRRGYKRKGPEKKGHRHKKNGNVPKRISKPGVASLHYAKSLIGTFTQTSPKTGYITSIHRKDPFPGVALEGEQTATLKHNDVLVFNLKESFELVQVIGNIKDPSTYSKIAIWQNDIPHVFGQECLDQAEQNTKESPSLNSPHRVDLRHIPFVTVDGEDAKDFDDAIYAEPMQDGLWKIMVAIADVSYYVEPATPLDHEALKRGNSVYFPNTVIPMLPVSLSNDLCSLRPNEDRLALAVEIIINPNGKPSSFKFMRSLIRSSARLTYKQVQDGIDGDYDKTCMPVKTEIENLYGAYKSLNQARKIRGTLNISIPEYKVIFDEKGHPKQIEESAERVSNKIIEEFMILANVCAAKVLLKKGYTSVYRNHKAPDQKRYESLTDVLVSLGHTIPKKQQLTPHTFNKILKGAENSDNQAMVQELVLRCQSQALYQPENLGHFGLSLSHYTHFTSPIRRYADLIVHRSLVNALNLDKHTYATPDLGDMNGIAEHISQTERKAAKAERAVKERYALYLLQKDKGKVVKSKVVGVMQAGLFINLEGTSAEGFVSVRDLDDDYYTFDEKHHKFVGRKKRKAYQLGQTLSVKILEVDPTVSKLSLKII
ncbi:MAG: ribonuclease R [Alphaproteobacteria bacterium CG_4_10_14_0_8_um_filter_37_21]|nr:MAG: ribonuclease R [Alphaproteobacteria bacterium CG_4_10_14_0_8_um_filter_37_21]